MVLSWIFFFPPPPLADFRPLWPPRRAWPKKCAASSTPLGLKSPKSEALGAFEGVLTQGWGGGGCFGRVEAMLLRRRPSLLCIIWLEASAVSFYLEVQGRCPLHRWVLVLFFLGGVGLDEQRPGNGYLKSVACDDMHV